MDNGDSIDVCGCCRDDNYEYCETCETWSRIDMHECPGAEEDDTPAEPLAETFTIGPYNRDEWRITLPIAYRALLSGHVDLCDTCGVYHIRGGYSRLFEIYNVLGEALRRTFEYPDHNEFIVNPGWEPWVIQGTDTGRI